MCNICIPMLGVDRNSYDVVFFLASITPGTQVDITLMVLASWLLWGLHSGCCMQVFPLVVQHVFQKVRARIGGYLFNCGTNVTWCSLHMGFNKPGLSICWLCCSHVGPSPHRSVPIHQISYMYPHIHYSSSIKHYSKTSNIIANNIKHSWNISEHKRTFTKHNKHIHTIIKYN